MAYAQLSSACLFAGSPTSSDFADNELWEGTNNDQNGNYWAEVGVSVGEINGQPRSGPFWFWADNRPGLFGGYNEHFVRSTSHTGGTVEIHRSSEGNWDVFGDGLQYFGTSTSNPGYSRFMSAGAEVTPRIGYLVAGSANSLSWHDSAWRSGWTSASGSSYTYATTNAQASWITRYNSVSYSAGGLCVSGSPAAGGMSEQPQAPLPASTRGPAVVSRQSSLVPPSALPRLAQLASAMGRSADDVGVRNGEVVLSTRGMANSVASGAVVASDEPVYLFKLRGQFAAVNGHMPPGHDARTGSVLTFTVDAQTGGILDWGVRDADFDLSSLGPIASIDW